MILPSTASNPSNVALMWMLCYLEPLLSENKYCPQASLSSFALVDGINQPLHPDFLSLIMPSVAPYFTPIISITSSSIFDILLFPGWAFIRRLFAN
jgi:hypothetical protein